MFEDEERKNYYQRNLRNCVVINTKTLVNMFLGNINYQNWTKRKGELKENLGSGHSHTLPLKGSERAQIFYVLVLSTLCVTAIAHKRVLKHRRKSKATHLIF